METDAPVYQNTCSKLRNRRGDDAADSAVSASSRSASPSPTSAARAEKPAARLSDAMLNPRTTSYEFLGPPGAFFLNFVLPGFPLLLNVLCTPEGCPNLRTLSSLDAALAALQEGFAWDRMFNWGALSVFVGWMAWCVAMYRVMPGEYVQGTVLRTGERLTYKVNAFNTLLFTLASLALIVNFHGLDPLIFVADNFIQIGFSAALFAVVLSTALYLASFRKGALLALGGNSGNPIYDFFIGRELNPRIGSFDLKYFCELRPGLIGWLLINLSFMAKQYATHGTVTDAMALVVVFQAWYVFDAVKNEAAVLTTMDITTDGFGMMLVGGDLVWVPFSYSLQARYLAMHDATFLGPVPAAAILAVNLLGYWIFRSANSEKDAFRSNPNAPDVAHLKYMETASGSKLLVSGWWGIARHINYFGDWIMSVAWSLPCGFADPLPYYYPIYFAILLVHRFYRDEHKCKSKYGKDWDEYCRRVPSRIVPYVF
ncbi:erg24, C-14 sterol reductase [Blastocladiella emersonii ATCC 22665]|nr:erg24, C-14 sterol reductase [Blastocladiella emersonii ATCC 22665]